MAADLRQPLFTRQPAATALTSEEPHPNNIAFGPRLADGSTPQADAEARRRLRDLDLGSVAERRLGDLAPSLSLRVALARVLAAGHDVLVLDAPFDAVGGIEARRARRLLRPLLWDRITVLLTTDRNEATDLADRMVVLDAGRLVDEQ